MTETGRLVFDAEAIVAYFADEPGAEMADEALHQIIGGESVGYLNDVNAAEIWYVLKRHVGVEAADDHLDWLVHEACLELVSSTDTWKPAAAIKADHRMSLGDAFALATAQTLDCPVLTGSDGEFDAGDQVGVEVRRARSTR